MEPKPYAQYDVATQRRPNLTQSMIWDPEAPIFLVDPIFFVGLLNQIIDAALVQFYQGGVPPPRTPPAFRVGRAEPHT